MSLSRRLASAALTPVRRHGRTVAWTPEFMGLGNLLHLGMWAHAGSATGEPRWLRTTPKFEPWLDVFPGLRQLVLSPEEVRFLDRRVMPWTTNVKASGVEMPAPYTPVNMAEVEDFLGNLLLPGSRLASLPTADPDELLVNVRRGDYYSVPEIRAEYGFDLATYLSVAVNSTVATHGAPAKIAVVSDGIDWCREHLEWLEDISPTTFEEPGDPVRDFTRICTARRMVITNSTFSCWGAHVSNYLHGDNHALIWAPRFFDRTRNGGRSWLLDERWSVVESLPGGGGE